MKWPLRRRYASDHEKPTRAFTQRGLDKMVARRNGGRSLERFCARNGLSVPPVSPKVVVAIDVIVRRDNSEGWDL